MPLSSLKKTFALAKNWLSARFSQTSSNAFDVIDFAWIDDRIGYTGISRALFGKGSQRHDYTFNYHDAELGGDMPVYMRYDIMSSDDLSHIGLYSGYADAHTGTVVMLQRIANERYRITDFYTCENGRHVENLPMTEENVGDFMGETVYVLNLIHQREHSSRVRASLTVVTGGLKP